MTLQVGVFLVIICLTLLQVCPGWATQKQPRPLLLGVDNAGFYFHPHSKPGFDVWEHKPFTDALKELGINFFVFHFVPVTDKGAENEALTLKRLQGIDEGMRANGLSYVLNNEMSNWIRNVEITPGVNEFAHADGAHRWDIRMSWLKQMLPPAKPGNPALLGVIYDEAEHMQLTGHQFCVEQDSGEKLDAACFAVTDGLTPEDACNRLVEACRRIRTEHYEGRLQLAVEQVWPDMFHIFANAGWNVCPKILKEHLSSVVMSIALGAALQYQDRVPGFWVTPDLWCWASYPGHSPEALRSALLTGYWLGADAIYVENLDWPHAQQRHPQADEGALLHWTDSDNYKITTHGRVLQDFAKNYVPKHPRKIDWRGYRPKVAIIRLPDGAWGQKDTTFRDRLLGNRMHPMDEISAEWLQVWPILTHGAARAGAISTNNDKVYPEAPPKFFVPIDSVAVFDHLVTGKVLDSVECFVVCGHALSAATFKEISKRVADGAVCVIARRLYDKHAKGTLPGKWTIVDSFSDKSVAAALTPFVGPPNVARYAFDDCVVEFRPAKDQDILEVKVVDKMPEKCKMIGEKDADGEPDSDLVIPSERDESGDLVIVRDGKPLASIIISSDPGEKSLLAAHDLRDHIHKMSGAVLPVRKDDREWSGTLLLVGPSKYLDKVGVKSPTGYPGSEKIIVKTVETAIALVGNDEGLFTGTEFAVQTLLEKLGCGWFTPDPLWQPVPEKKTISIPSLNIEHTPAFEHRRVWIGLGKRWYEGGTDFEGGHSHAVLFPPSEYFASNPEYYAQIDGKRTAEGEWQLCTSNPDVIRLTVEKARDYFDKHPGLLTFSLGNNDCGGFCECEDCTRTGSNPAARMLAFSNAVAKELRKTHPGKYVTNYAYWHTYEAPKEQMQAEPGAVFFAVGQGCHAHPITSPDCPNSDFRANIERWAATGACKGVHEWYIPGFDQHYWRRIPWIAGRTALADQKYLRSIGVSWITYESQHPYEEKAYPLRWPLLYVAAKGMWDAGLTFEEIMRDACKKLFGPAADHMYSYYAALERAMRDCPEHGTIWNLPNPLVVYPADVQAGVAGHLRNAEEVARDAPEDIRKRIEQETEVWKLAEHTLSELRRADKM